jgi:hypothetical protein
MSAAGLAVPALPGIRDVLRAPVSGFAALRRHPLVARPLLVHLAGGLALGAAAAVRGAGDLEAAVRDAAPAANETVVAATLAFLMVTLTPVLVAGSLLASGVVFHALCRLAGSRSSLRASMSVVLVALVPVALRNLLLGAAVLVAGGAVVERLGALRFGDPFLLISLVLVGVGAHVAAGLSRRAAAGVALATCAFPVLMQLGGL